MVIVAVLVIVATLIVINIRGTGTYPPMTGTVVDAEIGQPIEDAVVLVEWTKTHGFGEHWTESYRVEEAVTDKDGKFAVPGLDERGVNQPDVTIYKKGYVAWNNKYIFPAYEKRNDFEWASEYIFKLEKYLSSYSYVKHQLFIEGAGHLSLASEKKKLFDTYYITSEGNKVQNELGAR